MSQVLGQGVRALRPRGADVAKGGSEGTRLVRGLWKIGC